MPETHNSEFWDYVDHLIAHTRIVIDRPANSAHPDYDDMIYPLDYGYLAGTTSSDGSGIDVWLGAGGSQDVVGVICTVDLLKRDTEVKLLLGCTAKEMRTVVDFLNHSDGIRCFLVKRETAD
ncbi:MAG: inorganic pyrophosphatase [Chloroflexota bacterium]